MEQNMDYSCSFDSDVKEQPTILRFGQKGDLKGAATAKIVPVATRFQRLFDCLAETFAKTFGKKASLKIAHFPHPSGAELVFLVVQAFERTFVITESAAMKVVKHGGETHSEILTVGWFLYEGHYDSAQNAVVGHNFGDFCSYLNVATEIVQQLVQGRMYATLKKYPCDCPKCRLSRGELEEADVAMIVIQKLKKDLHLE